jgi:hypothetical protein
MGKQLRPLHVNSIRSAGISRGGGSLRSPHSTSANTPPRQPAGPFRAQVQSS